MEECGQGEMLGAAMRHRRHRNVFHGFKFPGDGLRLRGRVSCGWHAWPLGMHADTRPGPRPPAVAGRAPLWGLFMLWSVRIYARGWELCVCVAPVERTEVHSTLERTRWLVLVATGVAGPVWRRLPPGSHGLHSMAAGLVSALRLIGPVQLSLASLRRLGGRRGQEWPLQLPLQLPGLRCECGSVWGM
jgi:hypothetical protein